MAKETCNYHFSKSIKAPQNLDVDFILTVEKLSDSQIYYSFTLNGVQHELIKNYVAREEMPYSIDTFAITIPNHRGL